MKNFNENLPIGVFDSGIGGLCVLKDLQNYFPSENFVYYGDNLNAPYGNKDISTLKALTINSLNLLTNEKVKAIVIGCNTLSANLYKFIKESVRVSVIKTLPPICNDRNKALLCTVKTANSSFVKRNFKGKVIPLEDLAIQIEKNALNLSKIDLSNVASVIPLTTTEVVLGCTHYHLVKTHLENLIKIPVTDSYETVKYQLELELKKHKLFKNLGKGEIKFIGECADFNEKIFKTIL